MEFIKDPIFIAVVVGMVVYAFMIYKATKETGKYPTLKQINHLYPIGSAVIIWLILSQFIFTKPDMSGMNMSFRLVKK